MKNMEVFATDDEVNDKISGRNGQAHQRKFRAKRAEKGGPTFSNGQKIEENGDGVLSKVAENGKEKQESENLVFFDKDEGLWKCRVCSWKSGSVLIDNILDHSNNGSKPLDDKFLDFEFTFGGDNKGKRLLANGKSKKFGIRRYYGPTLDLGGCSSSFESSKEILVNDVLMKVDEIKQAKLDVERVLLTQTTDDRYCPNCNSCITSRVILCKRKSTNQISDNDKPKKAETAAISELDIISVQDDAVSTHLYNFVDVDTDRYMQPDIFRCSSCFCFFIPDRNGFKVIRTFVDISWRGNVGDGQVPIRTIFASDNQGTVVDQGNSFQVDKEISAVKDGEIEQLSGYTNNELQESKFSRTGESTICTGLSPILVKSEYQIPSLTTQNAEPVAGRNTGMTIDAGPFYEIDPDTFRAETTTVLSASAQISISVYEKTEGRKDTKVEVIKSIVYGGIAESIVSLSLVLSAVGGDAATINVIALVLANLIGGVLVICHNLWELRSDGKDQYSDQVSNQLTEENDRYKELLGQRENFPLHSVVSILSYLIFGSIPGLVYGFFRVSDAKELKIVAVAIASLWCITALALAKAYVCTPRKSYIKTVLIYIALGFLTSSTSYVVGVLVKRFLDKLGLFHRGAVADLIPHDSVLASY